MFYEEPALYHDFSVFPKRHLDEIIFAIFGKDSKTIHSMVSADYHYFMYLHDVKFYTKQYGYINFTLIYDTSANHGYISRDKYLNYCHTIFNLYFPNKRENLSQEDLEFVKKLDTLTEVLNYVFGQIVDGEYTGDDRDKELGIKPLTRQQFHDTIIGVVEAYS